MSDQFEVARHSKRLVEQQCERIAALEAERDALRAELAALKAPAVADKVFTSGFATRPAQTEQQPVAWLIDWPEEPELGHYFSDEPNEHARSRPLYAAPIAQTPADGLVGALEATNQLLRTKRHACENPQVCHVLDVHIERNRAALAAHRAQGERK